MEKPFSLIHKAAFFVMVMITTTSSYAGLGCPEVYSFNGEAERVEVGNKPSGREYVLLNETNNFQVKEDIFNYGLDVNFYTSEDWFVGEDEYNVVSGTNVYARKGITFNDPTSVGLAWVAVLDIFRPVVYCNEIVVQAGRPSITGSYSESAYPTKAIFNYTIDRNSKAYRTGEGALFTLKYGSSVIASKMVYDASGQIVIERPLFPDGTSAVGTINDGNYSASVSVYNPPTMPDACRTACPDSLGWYQAQCQSSSQACNYRVW